MVKELQQRTVKAGCLTCNGSLNAYDSYSCPICQGTGLVEVQALEEAKITLSNPVSDKKETVMEVAPMLKEMKSKIGLVKCLACNGSLNAYDSYSCPVCQGTGLVEVQTVEEVLLPKAVLNAEILVPEEVLLPKTGSIADGYEFFVEHL